MKTDDVIGKVVVVCFVVGVLGVLAFLFLFGIL